MRGMAAYGHSGTCGDDESRASCCYLARAQESAMAPDTSDYYIAVVLFVSTSDSATYRPLYEESLLLVTAADEDALAR